MEWVWGPMGWELLEEVSADLQAEMSQAWRDAGGIASAKALRYKQVE